MSVLDRLETLAAEATPTRPGEVPNLLRLGNLHAACTPATVAALVRVVKAASDPFLVLLASHPESTPEVNAEMRRAADALRTALTAFRAETPA